jgi:hypothetical protein
MTGLAIGFLLVALLGAFHHLGLHLLSLALGQRRGRRRTLFLAFMGLLAIHTLEILGFAGAYRAMMIWDGFGTIVGVQASDISELIYFSGIAFSTLGYPHLVGEGPIRMVSMMQSLGGFMILTWSASFIYALWNDGYRD